MPPRRDAGGSFIDTELRRVDTDIAAFPPALTPPSHKDTRQRNRTARSDGSLLRAGARTRIELERL